MISSSLALFALIDQPLVNPRIRREEPERWAEKVAGTSAITLLAALQGKGRLNLKEMSFTRISVLLMLCLVILFTHEHVIGFSTLPG